MANKYLDEDPRKLISDLDGWGDDEPKRKGLEQKINECFVDAGLIGNGAPSDLEKQASWVTAVTICNTGRHLPPPVKNRDNPRYVRMSDLGGELETLQEAARALGGLMRLGRVSQDKITPLIEDVSTQISAVKKDLMCAETMAFATTPKERNAYCYPALNVVEMYTEILTRNGGIPDLCGRKRNHLMRGVIGLTLDTISECLQEADWLAATPDKIESIRKAWLQYSVRRDKAQLELRKDICSNQRDIR